MREQGEKKQVEGRNVWMRWAKKPLTFNSWVKMNNETIVKLPHLGLLSNLSKRETGWTNNIIFPFKNDSSLINCSK